MKRRGGGSRTCIGKNVSSLMNRPFIRACSVKTVFGLADLEYISLYETHKLVAELLRSYERRLVNPEVEFRSINNWINKPKSLFVRVYKRDSCV